MQDVTELSVWDKIKEHYEKSSDDGVSLEYIEVDEEPKSSQTSTADNAKIKAEKEGKS